MDYFIDVPKEIKIYESEKHGKELLNQYPEINKLISDWLKKYL
ncbi:MAG TPA: hypothetical protein VIK14_09090 [Ignavibacteria bacterium]